MKIRKELQSSILSLLLVTDLLIETGGLASVTPSSQAESSTFDAAGPVSVWDNVLPVESLDTLHQAASSVGLGHRVFKRPLNEEHPNVIERTLDEILTQMGEPIDLHVEYWTRQEWRHIEAHADIDENLAKRQDAAGESSTEFRYPIKGHVLYLQVGSEVRGPTCVFPTCSSGGDLAQFTENVQLVTVPAVPGRLLQFDGHLLHTVPRPTDLWFLSFVKGTPEFNPEQTWGRSVILFNTWPADGPPKDVPMDLESGSVCQTDSTSSSSVSLSHAREQWKPVTIHGAVTDEDAAKESAKIWLLGNGRRRGHMYRTIKLTSPTKLRDALREKSQVQLLSLENP